MWRPRLPRHTATNMQYRFAAHERFPTSANFEQFKFKTLLIVIGTRAEIRRNRAKRCAKMLNQIMDK